MTKGESRLALVIKKGVDYINLRLKHDKSVLECVLDELESSGDDAVIIPWLSPPFNIPRGMDILKVNCQRISQIGP